MQILPRAQKWHITIIRRPELAAPKRPARIFKMLRQGCKSQQNNAAGAATWASLLFQDDVSASSSARALLDASLADGAGRCSCPTSQRRGISAPLKSVPLPGAGFARAGGWKERHVFPFRMASGANQLTPRTSCIVCLPGWILPRAGRHPPYVLCLGKWSSFQKTESSLGARRLVPGTPPCRLKKVEFDCGTQPRNLTSFSPTGGG